MRLALTLELPSLTETGCAQRGLTCTSDYVINKASNGAGRPGRLMEQVKLLYGSGETSSGSDSTTPELPLIAVPTSPQSPENVLAATQQAEFVASALIDTFKRYLFKWRSYFSLSKPLVSLRWYRTNQRRLSGLL